ncbi:hypothetical protein AB0O01_31440 [Streptomyces sp. NPDC093252]|uniref:Rv1733c family protein n=1 Tax=Streptomyces sp. NPDC093252 TaxID=3154980 RepID=UPI00341FCF59
MVIRRRKVWLWRWRRNPLRRGSDAADAWVLLATWTLAVLVAALAGLVTARSVGDALARERVEWRPVTAVLTEPASGIPSRAVGELVWARVTWTDPDGSPRTGRARVVPCSRSGGEVTVWTDPAGRLVTAPTTVAEAHVRSLLVGGMAGTVGAVVPLVAGSAVRGRLERRRLDRWEADWARFDALWGRHMG